MRAGELRHRGQCQRKVVARNAIGEEVIAWSTFATRWMSVETTAGSEGEVLSQETVRRNVTVGMRSLAGLKSIDRIVVDGRTLEVVAVLPPDKRGGMMTVRCIEVLQNAE